MDLRNILSEIGKTDPEVYEKLSGRRQVLKNFGSKVAVAALPLAVASMFSKAYGKTTSAIIDALNFALELEYMEFNFYHEANNVTSLGLIPAADQPGFLAIEAHEKAHVTFLITTITALGGTPFKPNHYSDATSAPPYIPAAYDFRASSNTVYAPLFANVFNDYPTFLIAAQTFEDSHIRAVNGQMSNWAGNAVFAQMQQLLATEGRHAAFIRLIRRNLGAVTAPEVPAPWITNNIPPSFPVGSTVTSGNIVLQPFYNGEDNTVQSGIDISTLTDTGSPTGYVPQLSASAAFDEPLTQTAYSSLIAPFILP